jgi:glycosyltransferase involved in cell wall biosynthesis
MGQNGHFVQIRLYTLFMHPITAVLPVKDAARYAEAIVGDLKTNLTSIDEAIVIDDHSTDGSYEIYKTFIGDDRRFTIIRNTNPGLANALNLGISIAKHDWIARFDSDDRYESDRIYNQRELLSEGVACVFSDYSLHDEKFKFITQIPSGIFDSCIKLSLVKNTRAPHPSVIFSKSKAVLAGGYRSSEFPAEDLGLWLRISEFGSFVSEAKNLLHYTVRRNSITSSMQAEMLDRRMSLIGNSKVLRKAFNDVEINWKEYFRNYELVGNSIERKILTMNEFRLTGRLFGLSYWKTYLKMVTSVLFKFNWVLPLFRLIHGKNKLSRARA